VPVFPTHTEVAGSSSHSCLTALTCKYFINFIYHHQNLITDKAQT